MIKTQEQIRQRVKELIPKQSKVANDIGIDPTYFNKWLNGLNIGSRKLDMIITWIQNK